MKINHDTNDEFVPDLPEAGMQPAVCCDLYDKGIVEHPKYGARERFLLGFMLAGVSEAFGERFVVWREYTKSLHPNANFRQDLERWRGAPLDVDESGEILFDVESLLGAPCMLNIEHSSDGRWANIAGIYPPRKGKKLSIDPKYVRKEEREKVKQEDAALTESLADATGDPDDDLPF